MPAPAPDRFQGPGENRLWGQIDNAFTEFCGGSEEKHLWPERRQKFKEVLVEMIKMVDEEAALVDTPPASE